MTEKSFSLAEDTYVSFLKKLTPKKYSIPDVKTLFFVLPDEGMGLDVSALQYFATRSYPHGAVFFFSADGSVFGDVEAPKKCDLGVDFSVGPWCTPWKWRKYGKVLVGRRSGFRKWLYDRVLTEEEEKKWSNFFPLHDRNFFIQALVLEKAGISLLPYGSVCEDESTSFLEKLPKVELIF